MVRLREGRPVHIRIPDALLEIIDRLAKERAVSCALVIRGLPADAIGQVER